MHFASRPTVAKIPFAGYQPTVTRALDLIGAHERLPQGGLIILKPNLTNSSPPPVTTPPEMVEAVCLYCREHTSATIVIGEGCGSGTTPDVYRATGYDNLADRLGLDLIDFNTSEALLLKNADAHQLTAFHLPRIAQDAFIISIPILKDHCFTDTTIAMKNMFGLAPAPFYRGSWNKSKLHSPSTHRSVVDVCLYKRPDLSVVDARVALSGMHLSGTPREFNTVIAGFDPVAVDATAGRLLGHEPEDVEYLRLAQGRIGSMEDVRVAG